MPEALLMEKWFLKWLLFLSVPFYLGLLLFALVVYVGGLLSVGIWTGLIAQAVLLYVRFDWQHSGNMDFDKWETSPEDHARAWTRAYPEAKKTQEQDGKP